MKLEIPEKVNPNCHVFKLGWTYPICIRNKLDFVRAKNILTPVFEQNAGRWHFSSWGSVTAPVVRYTLGEIHGGKDPRKSRWYADQRLWGKTHHYAKYDFWLVFKTEKDRTLAMLMLG
jgi:hypothetical protein